jgi:hypothetical protein
MTAACGADLGWRGRCLCWLCAVIAVLFEGCQHTLASRPPCSGVNLMMHHVLRCLDGHRSSVCRQWSECQID